MNSIVITSTKCFHIHSTEQLYEHALYNLYKQCLRKGKHRSKCLPHKKQTRIYHNEIKFPTSMPIN